MVGDNMNFENYIYELCDGNKATIVSHIEKPLLYDEFNYGMEKYFDNEMIIEFHHNPHNTTIIDFVNKLYKKYGRNENYDYKEQFGEEIMKEYDVLYVWWNNNI